MNRVTLSSGIAMPFYPMRPTPGARATAAQLDADLTCGRWCIQPKLDGDRACLGVMDGLITIQNRHLDRYSYNVINVGKFAVLPIGTCLDGEVWQKNFYPFELLADGSTSLLNTPIEERIARAKKVCEDLGVDWLFEAPTAGSWVTKNIRTKHLEGYVKKRRGSTYAITGVVKESGDYFKVKWR